jgi:putative FmdB family regulatory protein
MPTYEYHCDACEHHFDEFQSINDKPLKKCPKCGRVKLRRIFGTGAAVIFKGSGFYQTDYRSESYKAAAKAEQEAGKPASADKSSTTGTPSADGPANNGSLGSSSKSTRKTSKSKAPVSDD